MTTYAPERRFAVVLRGPAAAWRQAGWLGAGLVLGFLVPYVLADRLELPKDLYLGLYSVFALGLFAAWALDSGRPLRRLLARRLPLAVALGAVFAGVMALLVVKSDDAGPRSEGLTLVGRILWRGVVYGVADGILLSAFPILAVFAAFGSSRLRKRLLGKVAIGLVALAASLAMTAAYHAGYGDFRSEKLAKPVAGDVIWSAPTLLTLNPVGAAIAHAGQHVTAVLHNEDTELFLPPHR